MRHASEEPRLIWQGYVYERVREAPETVGQGKQRENISVKFVTAEELDAARKK